MRKKVKENIGVVNEMRNTLDKIRNLTLENYIMPDDEGYGEEQMPQETEKDNGFDEQIIQAIVQIRKISIGVIAKLADNPMSEGYTFMKRVLDMSDKAMESINNGGEK